MLGLLTTQGQINFRPSTDLDADPNGRPTASSAAAARSETEADAQCRTTRVMAALGTMLNADRRHADDDRPVLRRARAAVSEDHRHDEAREPDRSAESPPPATTSARSGRRTSRTSAQVASAARADLYLFHLTEGMVNRSSNQDSGIESLAGVTSAEFVRLTASPQASISRLLRETSAYYTATFDPDPSERNGGTFRVELRTTRDKTKLRSRPAVAIAKDVAKTAPAPKDMLRTPAAYADLPLRATVHSSRLPGSEEVKVMALFETLDPSATLTAASIGLFDEKNTLKKQWTAQSAELKARPVMAELSAPAGTYRVRVAAVDGAGRAGATDYELKVEVPRADPLKLSTLVLGTQKQGGGFQPVLDFSNLPIAIGILEIYGVPKGGAVTMELDIAQTAEGQRLATAETTVAPGDSEDMRRAFGGFNIASLAPGDYLMRAVVSLDGKPVGKVVRTLRKSQ